MLTVVVVEVVTVEMTVNRGLEVVVVVEVVARRLTRFYDLYEVTAF